MELGCWDHAANDGRMSRATTIARLKITLNDVRPTVMRRVDIPLSIKLDRLHLVIQAAMGWSNSHLWLFEAGGATWGDADAEFSEDLPANKTSLWDVVEDIGTKTLHYTYDFGDNWEHTIKIEGFRDPAPGTLYPQLIKATGRCPHEDVGGPPGYEMLLEIMADPDHKEYDEMIECYGEPKDSTEPETSFITAELDNLAKRWAPRRNR